MNRYARQMVLPEVGAQGQARLSCARVLVIGAGGLGCPALQYLGAAGIGRITIMDPDIAEESNLHRQVLYSMADLGRPKALAAQEHLVATSPDLKVAALQDALTPANAPALVHDADLVLDCADSFAVSYILSDTCHALGKPLISASALGQSGYVGGFCCGAPSLRAVFPDLPDRAANCATAGVLGPVVGVIGAMQAQMGLQVLLGSDPSPLGLLLSFNLGGFRCSSFAFHDAPEQDQQMRFISRCDLTEDDQIIELRPASEAPTLPHPQARRVAPESLPTLPLQDSARIVLCCRTGLRAWQAGRVLQARGLNDVALLADPGAS
ncbi:MAG: HesA/MoeB/ThiF family protein [Rhodobacteraceae bacterium]|nr:HesA/MoeB/ThiF family protein [Paracoccaceae bacterium]